MVEIMKIIAISFKRSHAWTVTLSAPNPAAPPPTHTSTRDSWTLTRKSGPVSCGFTAPFSWVLGVQASVFSLPESVSQSCVNSGGSMVSLMATSSKRAYAICYTQVCCTQNLCHCSSPLLTCTSTGDIQTQFCPSICGVSGFWCTQGMFEPIEHLWQVQCLILNTIFPLLPSFWGFTFALGK